MNERYFPTSFFPGIETGQKSIKLKRWSRRNFLKASLGGGGAFLVYQGIKWLERWLSQDKVQEVQKKVIEAKTGIELIEALGLQGKVVYIVYGRPTKSGEKTWGSLGASQTAEESWQVLQERKRAIAQEIGKNEEDFALNILNPVYRSQNGVIKDIYIQKALELAPENQGLVALSFNSIPEAKETLQRLESILPKEQLAYLAVSLDIEHFPNHNAEASSLNEFGAWFAEKHQKWSGDSSVPGIVLIYTMHGSSNLGKILNLDALVQYHQKTVVVPIFDGYGSREAKLSKMSDLVAALPNTQESPALVGVMEFRSKWGPRYDKAQIGEIFDSLQGAPVFFFASQ